MCGRTDPLFPRYQELFIINCLVYPKLTKSKKKNVRRKSIEKTSNLDIFCGNHFKDLHLRPTPNNVLSLLTAKKKLHPIERESTWISKLHDPNFFIHYYYLSHILSLPNRTIKCSLNMNYTFPSFLTLLKMFSLLLLLFVLLYLFLHFKSFVFVSAFKILAQKLSYFLVFWLLYHPLYSHSAWQLSYSSCGHIVFHRFFFFFVKFT